MKIAAIESLVEKLFRQRWKSFHDDHPFSDGESLKSPGVYMLAYTKSKLRGKLIKENDVLYVGMSNSQGGIRTRLKGFGDGLETYGIHSGAKRFYREYQNGRPFSKLKDQGRFFYATLTIDCISEKSKLQPSDLRELGHVACLEYYAIARIKQKTGRMPTLNKFGKRPD